MINNKLKFVPINCLIGRLRRRSIRAFNAPYDYIKFYLSSLQENIIWQMVYFWTYAHPLYCPSDLRARGFNSCLGPMHCRSDGHIKNSIMVHPTYFELSLGHVGLMGLFRRSDGHFS